MAVTTTNDHIHCLPWCIKVERSKSRQKRGKLSWPTDVCDGARTKLKHLGKEPTVLVGYDKSDTNTIVRIRRSLGSDVASSYCTCTIIICLSSFHYDNLATRKMSLTVLQPLNRPTRTKLLQTKGTQFSAMASTIRATRWHASGGFHQYSSNIASK